MIVPKMIMLLEVGCIVIYLDFFFFFVFVGEFPCNLKNSVDGSCSILLNLANNLLLRIDKG
jgi:hypothetical protein